MSPPRLWGGIFNLGLWFGYKVILPDTGIDVFALSLTGVSLLLLLKYHLPVHYLVPLGAVAGIIRRVGIPTSF